MKILLLSVLIISSSIAWGSVISTNTQIDQLKQKEIDRYLKVFSFEELVHSMAIQKAKRLPPSKRDRYVELVTQNIDYEEFYRIMTNVMHEHFSLNELKAIADFYGSPEGQSILKKYPIMMESAMPALRASAMKTDQKILKILIKEDDGSTQKQEKPNQKLQPTVKTPVDEVEAQGRAAEL